MAVFYHITKPRGKSKPGNRKVNRVGAPHIYVTTSGKQTCPPTCPLYEDDCYAEKPPLVYHWLKVTDGERGVIFPHFLRELRELPHGSVIRLNQAGDLPGPGVHVADVMLLDLVKTCQEMGHKVCTYTHKPVLMSQEPRSTLVAANGARVKFANREGFTINISCSNFDEVDMAFKKGFTAVTVNLPKDFHDKTVKKLQTSGGTDVVVCPADRFKGERGGDSKLVTCADCMICWQHARRFAVGFLYKDKSNVEARRLARERKLQG